MEVIKFEELAHAFLDVMEFLTVKDLRKITGLAEERCRQILEIYNKLNNVE
jgi:hypothetical protein